MAEGTSLLNLGELSKPITVFIEKVSDAVGGIAKPWQIQRVAKAEAVAAKLKASAQIEISDMEERALNRLIREAANEQETIESITAGAIPYLNADVDASALDEGWIRNLFDRGKNVTDIQMREIWSRILAEEANSAGSISRKTVEILSSMDKSDANIFSKIRSFVWNDNNPQIVYFMNFGSKEKYKYKLEYSDLWRMEEIGLLRFDISSDLIYTFTARNFIMDYFGRSIKFDFGSSGRNHLKRGNIQVTEAGKQLAKICAAEPDEAYLQGLLDLWLVFHNSVSISTTIESKQQWLAGGQRP